MIDQRIEWGVLWEDTGEVEPTESRRAAEDIISLYAWAAHVVSRVVIYDEWTRATR